MPTEAARLHRLAVFVPDPAEAIRGRYARTHRSQDRRIVGDYADFPPCTLSAETRTAWVEQEAPAGGHYPSGKYWSEA